MSHYDNPHISVTRLREAIMLELLVYSALPPRRKFYDQVGLPVILSMCSLIPNNLCMDLHEILPEVSLGPVSR